MNRIISVDSTFNGRKVMWDKDGYPYGWCPDSPMARKRSWKGYVPLHRYFKACDEHRPLQRDEVVHHKNGNKADERSENLVILTKAIHSMFHKRVDCGICSLDDGNDVENIIRIATKPIAKRKCIVCGAELWYKDCSRKPVFMCAKCSAAAHEKADWPSDEELQNMVFSRSYTEIAKELGISVGAIRKRIKTHGLIDPKKKPRKK